MYACGNINTTETVSVDETSPTMQLSSPITNKNAGIEIGKIEKKFLRY
jgi:hypothetical protein